MSGKVVAVIGAGYGGVNAAKACEQNGFDVLLVERYQSFFHKMAADRACVVPEFEKKVALPLDRILKRPRSKLVFGEVRGVDVEKQELSVRCGTDSVDKSFSFDFLIIAVGMRHTADIGQLSSKLLTTEEMHNEMKEKQMRIATGGEKVAVIGGGPAGCELAAEIKHYYPDKKVKLFHSKQHLVSNLSPPVSLEMAHFIKTTLEDKLDCETKLGDRVSPGTLEEDGYNVLQANGLENHEDTKTIFPQNWFLADQPYLKVNQFLQVEAVAAKGNIFAIGDIVGTHENKQARVARRHGNFVAGNVKRSHKGQSLLVYHPIFNKPLFQKAACLLSTFKPSYVQNRVPDSPAVLNITLGPYYLLQASNIVWSEKALSRFKVVAQDKYYRSALRVLKVPLSWSPETTEKKLVQE